MASDPNHRVRIALVGAGFIGRRHIGFLRGRPVFDLIAAADPTPSAESYLNREGIPYFADYQKMIAETKPDGVIVATPNALHEEVALACIEAGIPAMVEKPVTDRLDAARRLAAAADQRGVPVLVGHHRRHNPMLKTAKAFLDANSIGKVLSVTMLNLRRKPESYYDAAWRREPGGGPLLINGIHDFGCLRWLCGEIDSVYALKANLGRGFRVEDTAVVTIRFKSGVLGTLTLSDSVQAPWAWEIASGEEPEYPNQMEDCYMIAGTEGALAIPTLTHWRNERGGGRADPFIRKRLFYVPADPWVEELLHFARVIRGEEAPLVTIEDGARTLAAVMAVGQSSATGQSVSLDEMFR